MYILSSLILKVSLLVIKYLSYAYLMYYLFTEMYTRDMYKYRESFSGMTSWPCSKTDLVVFTSYYLDRYRYLFIPIPADR